MLIKFLTKIFSSRTSRILKKAQKIVDYINSIEVSFETLTDKQLLDKTKKFRLKLSEGKTLNYILPEAFATVREAGKRVFGLRIFDVQLLGAVILNNQAIAEMKTGEGKTLTASLPAYLHALEGKGVHIVTMNDYLAKRDAIKNTPLFNFLGLTVGLNLSGMPLKLKRKAYYSDITYGTNNEYGFDYLRDNMVFSRKECVQRGLNYALIDEVDSILIDEARTPLIISDSSRKISNIYNHINNLVTKLKYQDQEDSEFFVGSGDYFIDKQQRQVHLTERGLVKLENLLINYKLIRNNESLYSVKNINLIHHVIAALKAHMLYIRNVDYIIQNKEIIIVDEHTGRTMDGRRWSDGVHQAIEAKEGVKIKNENQILASITFQNYFKLYKKLSGMSGTACTEDYEFSKIYNLDTIPIPTNKPMIRKDFPDVVYMTIEEKINAIIKDILRCCSNRQPVLVGTASIEKSELISQRLKMLGVKHNVLNAKFHAKEAKIIAEAGKLGSVTIATNMAGRGTDIVLGGTFESFMSMFNLKDGFCMESIKKQWHHQHNVVLSVGGLHIIGTERHESRRIDNQLRGRAGRQGDPGSSQFYLSMEDSLMRLFLSKKIINVMQRLGVKKNEAIQHAWITKSISHAQCKVESYNFEIRKQLLEYDDVINVQRSIVYEKRNELINTDDISLVIYSISKDVFTTVIDRYAS
ncbi:preprotein translocase subunit SecA, partial [Buchnera aphidicola (Hormaphis cornu)]